MPLIRYRTGDVARWLLGPCACGFPFRRIWLRGRVDEQVSCAWGNLHPSFFEELIGSVPGASDEWQVAVMERAGKQVVQFRMEMETGVADEDLVRERILESLRRRSPAAWQAYEGGLIGIECRYYEKGRLRTGRKLRRLVDERVYADKP